MSKEKKLRDGKKHRRRRKKKLSLAEALDAAPKQKLQKRSRNKRSKKSKKKDPNDIDSMTYAELEDYFNAWNRQQTTGLTIDELTLNVNTLVTTNFVLTTLDLNIDECKMMRIEKIRKLDSLKNILKKLT